MNNTQNLDAVIWVLSTNADKHFRALGYTGKYPYYKKSVPGKLFMVDYYVTTEKTADNLTKYKLNINVCSAQTRTEGDTQTASGVPTEICRATLFANDRDDDLSFCSLCRLPCFECDSNTLGGIDKTELNRLLILIPIADRIVSSLKLKIDSLALEKIQAQLNAEMAKAEAAPPQKEKFKSGRVLTLSIFAAIAWLVFFAPCFAFYANEFTLSITAVTQAMLSPSALISAAACFLLTLAGAVIGYKKSRKADAI